jgi:hypothetical protein
MAGNSFGQLFRITTFGESHGEAIGVIVDGCPAGLTVDLDYIQGELDKRKPGQSKITTQRKEADTVKILIRVRSKGKPPARLSPCSSRMRISAQKIMGTMWMYSAHRMPIIPIKPNTASATIVAAAAHQPAKLRHV